MANIADPISLLAPSSDASSPLFTSVPSESEFSQVFVEAMDNSESKVVPSSAEADASEQTLPLGQQLAAAEELESEPADSTTLLSELGNYFAALKGEQQETDGDATEDGATEDDALTKDEALMPDDAELDIELVDHLAQTVANEGEGDELSPTSNSQAHSKDLTSGSDHGAKQAASTIENPLLKQAQTPQPQTPQPQAPQPLSANANAIGAEAPKATVAGLNSKSSLTSSNPFVSESSAASDNTMGQLDNELPLADADGLLQQDGDSELVQRKTEFSVGAEANSKTPFANNLMAALNGQGAELHTTDGGGADAIDSELNPITGMRNDSRLSATTATTANSITSATEAMRQPVNAERMAPELRDRLQMMINTDKLSAEIRLDPPELGALQVRIQMNGDQANVQIAAQQGQARELIEQALPRLREMLQEQGLQLGEADISQQEDGGADQGGESNGSSFDGDLSEGELETVAVAGRNNDGGIDYYA